MDFNPSLITITNRNDDLANFYETKLASYKKTFESARSLADFSSLRPHLIALRNDSQNIGALIIANLCSKLMRSIQSDLSHSETNVKDINSILESLQDLEINMSDYSKKIYTYKKFTIIKTLRTTTYLQKYEDFDEIEQESRWICTIY